MAKALEKKGQQQKIVYKISIKSTSSYQNLTLIVESVHNNKWYARKLEKDDFDGEDDSVETAFKKLYGWINAKPPKWEIDPKAKDKDAITVLFNKDEYKIKLEEIDKNDLED